MTRSDNIALPPQRWWSVGVAAGSLALAGVGSAFAIGAKNQYDDAEATCSPYGCTSAARSAAAIAGTRADVATGLFIGSGLFGVLAAVLWFTTDTPTQQAVNMTSRGGEIGCTYSF